MAKLQAERRKHSAGGGGNGQQVGVREIIIKPEAVDPDDVEMLQDLVMAAVNEALRKAEEMVNTEMGKITGGLNLGGLF